MGRLTSGLLARLLAGVAVAAAASTAFAADLPMPGPAPSYTPPPPARYDWSGIYFGGHIGGGLLLDEVTTTTTTFYQSAGTQTKLSPFSVIGGAQAGVNIEFNPVVVGVEGTWTSSAISGSQVTPSLLTAALGTSQESTSAPHWYATATGRVGIAINDLLLYAKGGGAWMSVDYTQEVVAGSVLSAQILTVNRHGYTVGGGIEYALNENISARLEYDYLDFGTSTYNFNNLTTTIGPVGAFPVSIKSDTHMFLFGANYRFYWSKY